MAGRGRGVSDTGGGGWGGGSEGAQRWACTLALGVAVARCSGVCPSASKSEGLPPRSRIARTMGAFPTYAAQWSGQRPSLSTLETWRGCTDHVCEVLARRNRNVVGRMLPGERLVPLRQREEAQRLHS
jgi:hypothetical protein